MSRSSRMQPPPPQYLTATGGTGHQVTDRLNGYTLTEYATAQEAEAAVELLNTDPVAALAAVRTLDEAQSGPAATARRMLRRYGYNWCLEQRYAIDLHSHSELSELITAGHLAMVWSHRGLPFYTTPERYRELNIVFQYDTGEMIPTAVESTLQRRPIRLHAMPDHLRNAQCETHAYSVGRCCPPIEEWECSWGYCGSNAVTKIARRRVCERCASVAASVAGIRLALPA
ncbi:hypothetical protein [Streptomyces sp. CA-251247]|uniref:hypothetical protein n=1 Tax=Streptomyces sp. CA-251247 TaxID=3240062 RepID=UPI003D8D1B00